MSQPVHDPVCGMMVDPQTTPHQSSYQGQSYHFCGAGCKKAFDGDPQKYTQQDKEISAPK